MGKEISHILCAEQTFQALAGRAGGTFLSILRDHAREFHFGSIAADTFFYGIRSPFSSGNPSRCGDLIHGAEGADTGRCDGDLGHGLSPEVSCCGPQTSGRTASWWAWGTGRGRSVP